MKKYQLFIDGKWQEAVSGKTFYSINPSSGEAYAEVAEAGAKDVDIAVKAARQAFENSEWSNMAPSDRGRLLMRVANLIRDNQERLAVIESTDNGLPINETKYIAIPSMIDVLEFYAGLANKIQGSTLSSPNNRFNYTLKEPLGVVGAIVPWNFPLMLTMWKLAPALAAGNTIVIKPSEHTPISILEMVQLFKEAGMPDGVINVIPGFGKEAGNALVSHPDIDKIAFTGSTKTGQLIMQTASKNVTDVSLELGGKSPNIVFEDANIEHAVNGSMFGIFFAQGQVCASGTRLFVQDSIYDEFVKRFVEKAKTIRVGDPLDEATQMGPQTSTDQLEKIEYYVSKGKEEGATLLLGGERNENLQKGNYYTPTVFGDVTNDMTIAREEIFGPVLSIIRFTDEEDVTQKANDTLYGLAAGVWTSNLQRAHRMTKKLKAGTVYVNTFSMLDTVAPFGGMKQSGIGRELGIEALQMYTTTKHVWIDLNEDGFNWYGV